MSKPRKTRAAPSAVRLEPHGDERRGAILAGALEIFMRYGFSRVTMDDIARQAGISRPALYRDFRNKADIYAAIAAALLDRAAGAAEQALAGNGPLAERLVGAIQAGILDLMTEISRSPHGAEILEVKDELTTDILAGWRARMTAALAAAIAAEARARGIDLAVRGLAARGLAETLLDAIEGAKRRADDPAQWRKTARRLVALVMLALE